MKKHSITFFAAIFLLALAIPCQAQYPVWHQGISETNINVRGNPVTVGQININITQPGKVVVHFDGQCYADVGDLIVLAASNSPNWTPNDGNVGVEVVNSDVNHESFSHTRVYNVNAGSHDFYAVAQNYVETAGSGIASIYASLTVEFFPDIANYPFVEHQGISETNINVRGNPVTVGQININVTQPGKVVVHFDGDCYADVGDRIILAASDSPNWSINDGNVGVEVVNSDVNHASFSHTRVYDVAAGSHDFYAVAQNYVEMDGSGIASIYASLTVEFFPDIANYAFVEHEGIVKTSIYVRGNPVTVGQININVTQPGKVEVHFDGSCYADVGDLIVLAASDSPNWTPNDGVEVVDTDVNHAPFSHTRVYDVSAGSYDFYAVTQNYVETAGNGLTSIYASLTVKYFPEIVNDVPYSSELPNKFSLEQNYPNPFNPATTIKYSIPAESFVNLKVYNCIGQEVAELVNEERPVGNYEVSFDAAKLPSGIYFYSIRAGKFLETKKMMLLK
jgi:hypothetical protein